MAGRARIASVYGRWPVLLVCAGLGVALPAAAQTNADELGRKHFEAAVAYLEERDYENALKAFEKSYELSKRHEILLNIATVHEKRGDLPAAAAALERYLELAPQSEHAPGATERLAVLKQRLEPQPAPVPAAPEPQEPQEPFVPRYGFLAAGGIVLRPEDTAIAFRVDAGLPVWSTDRTYLRLLAVTTFEHHSDSGFDTYALAPFATVQHGWIFASKPKGRFSVIAEGGAGPIFAWIKTPDRPFMPAEWQSDVFVGIRVAGALEYQGRAGWLVALQPPGVLFTIVDGDLEATFELALRAGYQWP